MQQPPAVPKGLYFKWEQELWTLLWVGAAEGGLVPGVDGLLIQEFAAPQIVQALNKDLLPFSPTSASRICLWVAAGSQTPTFIQ